MTLNRISKYLIVILATLVVVVGITYVYASHGWTGPTVRAPDIDANPPNSNVPAPINVGVEAQIKDGGLAAQNVTVTSFKSTNPNPPNVPDANKVCFDPATGKLGICFTTTGPGCSITGGSLREYNDPANVDPLSLSWSVTKNTNNIASINFSNIKNETMIPSSVVPTGSSQTGAISTSVDQNDLNTYKIDVKDSSGNSCSDNTKVTWNWRSYAGVSAVTSLGLSKFDTYAEISNLAGFSKSSTELYKGAYSISSSSRDVFVYFLCSQELCSSIPSFAIDGASSGGTSFGLLGTVSFENEFYDQFLGRDKTSIYNVYKSQNTFNNPQTLKVE